MTGSAFESKIHCKIHSVSRVPYNKLLTNLASSSLTGGYWPSVVFVGTSLRSVRTVTTSGQYSPVRPSRSVSKRLIFPNFANRACCEKYLKDNKHNTLHLGRKFAQIFVLGHYLFLEAHSFPRAFVRLPEQTMSADKYPSIFSRQMEAIVYIDLAKPKSGAPGGLFKARLT